MVEEICEEAGEIFTVFGELVEFSEKGFGLALEEGGSE